MTTLECLVQKGKKTCCANVLLISKLNKSKIVSLSQRKHTRNGFTGKEIPIYTRTHKVDKASIIDTLERILKKEQTLERESSLLDYNKEIDKGESYTYEQERKCPRNGSPQEGGME